MRTILTISLLLVLSNCLKAQDTLYKADGTIHIVLIQEIISGLIKYVPISNQNGPISVIHVNSVMKIVYQDGTTVVFPPLNGDHIYQETETESGRSVKYDPGITDFRRNFIAVDALDLIKKTLTVSYEHIFKSGELGLQIPVSMRWNPEEEVYSTNDFSVGFNVNLYPFGQSPTNRSSLYFGPSITYRHYALKYSNMPSQGAMELIFNGGYLLRPFKYLNLAITGGVGWKEQFPAQSYISFSRGIIMRGGVQLGIKF